jgi:branched-chain amino acid transport system ATP-binding protein
MTTPHAEPLFEIRGLHAFYGTSHILHGVNLKIHKAQSMALLGRNGMGKTTLIRSALGIVGTRRGEVLVSGRQVTRLTPFEIARLGVAYVPEGRGIFPNLTVRENLAMAARPGVDGTRRWSIDRVLDAFPKLKLRYAHMGDHLSGGEQQMLSIGRALATNPQLLILDEATEGLAPVIAQQIWKFVGELRAEGMSMLLVDRNYRALIGVTDLCMILVKGQAVFSGPSSELAADPQMARQHLALA